MKTLPRHITWSFRTFGRYSSGFFERVKNAEFVNFQEFKGIQTLAELASKEFIGCMV
jgi:hypothetical protein